MMLTMYKYEEIVAELTRDIKDGEFKSGDKLPSMSELREEFEASYGSIRTAIIILKTQGLVEGKHGVGVFVK
jgi:DNA-binding GntR family transcriptional regulator